MSNAEEIALAVEGSNVFELFECRHCFEDAVKCIAAAAEILQKLTGMRFLIFRASHQLCTTCVYSSADGLMTTEYDVQHVVHLVFIFLYENHF